MKCVSRRLHPQGILRFLTIQPFPKVRLEPSSLVIDRHAERLQEIAWCFRLPEKGMKHQIGHPPSPRRFGTKGELPQAVRFRIVLPSTNEDFVRDIPLPLGF
jgi:hypothetical protein